jgi:hypothetical protein
MRSAFLVLFTVVCLLVGCAGLSTAYRGSTVPEGYRVPILQGAHSDVWRTEDIIIDYRYKLSQASLHITGDVRFAGRISGNFQSIPYFYMSLISLDAQGRVLQTSPLMTNSPYSNSEDLQPFSKVLALPPGVASISFEYGGNAITAGGRSGNSMDFWLYPIY